MMNVADNVQNSQDYNGQEFIGVVVAVDTTGQGRVKVRIPGLFEEGELPWIGCKKASPFGSGPGYGCFGTPPLGAEVTVRLQNGDANYGMYTGTIITINNVHPDYTDPNAWGYVDPSGTQLLINFQSKHYTFKHASGKRIDIDAEGNTSIRVPGNKQLTVDKDWNIQVQGNVNLQCDKATVRAQALDVYAATVFHSSVEVKGMFTAVNGYVLSGGSSDSATMSGNVYHNGGQIWSNNVSVSNHRHTMRSDSETNSPTPGT